MPDYDLASTLERVRGLLPGVISAEALNRVLRTAGGLPAALTNWVYLEEWLQRDRLDLIVRVDERGRDLLLQRTPAAPSCVDRSWQRTRELGRSWGANPRLRRDVCAIWLEFDLDDVVPDAPLAGPRVFVDFTTAAASQPSVTMRHTLALEALAPLVDGQVTAGTAERLHHLLAVLPRGARLIYVGAARDGRTLRACIHGLGHRLLAYLDAVRWPGDLEELAARVLTPLTGANCMLLHLDFTEVLLPRAGLEYVFDRRAQLCGVVREQTFFERLAERDLCDPGYCSSVRSWPGQSTELLDHEVWYSRVVRRLNHVKVVYEGPDAMAAKAYLCFFHKLASGVPALFDRRGAHLAVPPPSRAASASAGVGAT